MFTCLVVGRDSPIAPDVGLFGEQSLHKYPPPFRFNEPCLSVAQRTERLRANYPAADRLQGRQAQGPSPPAEDIKEKKETEGSHYN